MNGREGLEERCKALGLAAEVVRFDVHIVEVRDMSDGQIEFDVYELWKTGRVARVLGPVGTVHASQYAG